MVLTTSMTKLLDGIVLIITVICFGINIKEMALFWTLLGSGLIVSDLIVSLRYPSWRYTIPRWLLNVLAIALIVFTFARINWDNAVNVLLECFICLVAVKWIERRKTRDYLQIIALCVFALVSHAFFTFGIGYLITIMIVMVGCTASLVILTGISELESITYQPITMNNRLFPLSWLLGYSLAFLVISIPISFILFFILPRTETPLLPFLNREVVSHTGFSSVVELGAIEKIQEDETVAFRALLSDTPPQNLLYWRGTVYDYFDGKSWKSTIMEYPRPYSTEDKRKEDNRSNIISQTIILESSGGKFLFCLDVPHSVKGFPRRLFTAWDERIFFTDRPMDRRMRYECLSTIGAYSTELSSWDMERYRAIPANWESKEPILQLVRNTVELNKDQLEIAKKLELWLKSPPFQYSLSGLPLSDRALEDFLFKTKRGNCEYFASALAVMLRMVGIPARLVGGYHGGYFQKVGSYYLVLQKNAHVWVEAFIEDKTDNLPEGDRSKYRKGRWLRLDPTPYSPLMERAGLSLRFRLRLALDFIQYSWNRLVVQYDMREQERIARNIGERFSHLRTLLSSLKGFSLSEVAKKIKSEKPAYSIEPIVMVGGSILLTLALLWMVGKRLAVQKDHLKLLRKFEKHLAKRYSARRPSETLREWFNRIGEQLSANEREVGSRFIEIYEKCLYGAEGFQQDEIKQLKDLLKRLGRSPD